MSDQFNEPGYEKLADVLSRAFDQAARGKGKERHAQGEPFHEQVMQDGARRFGSGALLFQAFKKSEESQRLPHDRAIAELLGSIVYLAGAVIALEQAVGVAEIAQHAAPLSQPSDGFTWRSHEGGPCPVASDLRMVAYLREGELTRTAPASEFDWSHSGSDGDIIFYRKAT